MVVWVPGCGVAAWWQVTIAMSGNALGWLYAVEWPVFAVLGVLGWWQLVHDDPETIAERRRGRLRPAAAIGGRSVPPEDSPPDASEAAPALTADNVEAILRAEHDDDELASYNAYLASLAATGRRKSWRDPTGDRS